MKFWQGFVDFFNSWSFGNLCGCLLFIFFLVAVVGCIGYFIVGHFCEEEGQ